MMHSNTQLYSPHRTLECAMVEAITPDSVTDGVSTEEMDENLCSAVSPGLSDELVDHNLGRLSSQLNPGMVVVTSNGYSPSVPSTPATEKNGDKKWNVVKVHVGFDVTRKGERSLVIDGYKFTKSRDGMGDRVFWRCSRRECKATAVTVADRVEHIRAIHSHQPPVAAEFFADNTARCEQEVRFNNSASYPRSRVRRRSQPDPLEPLRNKAPTRDNTQPHPAHNQNTLHMDHLEGGQLHSVSSQRSDQVPSDYASNLRSNGSINGFNAQTLTALITHLVETNPSAKSFRSPTSSGVEPTSVSTQIDPLDSWCVTRPTDSGNYVSVQSDHLENGHHSIQCNGTPSAQSGPSGLEQLAAIATSFATSGTTVSSEPRSGTPRTQSECRTSSMGHPDLTPISPDANPPLVGTESGTDNNGSHPSNDFIQCANVISPGTVGFIGKNSQGQLVVLSGEQLSELLRAQQLPHNPARSPSSGHQQYSSSAWEHPSSPGQSSVIDLHTAGPGQAIDHWPHSTESDGSDPREILSRLDGLPKSLSCIVSLSNKSPDEKLQPIMVTALQVQPPGSPVPSTLVPFHTLGLQSSSPPRELSNHAGVEPDCPTSSTICVVSEDVPVSHSQLNIHQAKVSGPPGLLVHWKKEKMRESVEEDCAYPEAVEEDHSELVPLTENSVQFTTRPGAYTERTRRHSVMGVLEEEGPPPPKISCCCEDVSSKPASHITIPSTSTTTTTATSSVETFHLGCMEGSVRHQSLTVSVGTEEEESLCNQVQDGVLVKVLNTVQQLTAKLDADADPPEVIQNCRAIQACLDTIAAIKRVRSLSGTCSPKTGLEGTVKAIQSTAEAFSEASLLPTHANSQTRGSGLQSIGYQTTTVGHFMDSAQNMLPV